MFRRILVPLDGSTRAEQALPVAARIARASAGTVILVRVVTSPIDFAWYNAEAPQAMEATLQADEAKARAYINHVASSELLEGIAVITEVLTGTPANTLFEAAKARQADLMVMCSHGDTGLKRWVLGSVAQKVARHSPIPVLVLRESAGTPGTLHPEGPRPVRVMLATDNSPLAEEALESAAYLSAALSAPLHGELHLVHIVPLPTSQGYDEMADMLAREQQQFIADANAKLTKAAHQLTTGSLAQLQLNVTTSLLIANDVAETLIETAELGREDAAPCDVMVMATHGRSGPQRWVMGSVTERVLGATRLPLLIVRPHKSVQPHKAKDVAGETQPDKKEQTSDLDTPLWVGLL